MQLSISIHCMLSMHFKSTVENRSMLNGKTIINFELTLKGFFLTHRQTQLASSLTAINFTPITMLSSDASTRKRLVAFVMRGRG